MIPLVLAVCFGVVIGSLAVITYFVVRYLQDMP